MSSESFYGKGNTFYGYCYKFVSEFTFLVIYKIYQDVMDYQVMTKVNSIKYRGRVVDHRLNWIDHITYVKAKISKGIGIMYKAGKYLNKNSLKTLYHA